MLNQVKYRAVSGYLFISFLFLLLLLTVTSCSNGGGGSGGSSNSPSGIVAVGADPGPIITVNVGSTATLDGSDSTPEGGVSYSWSIVHKPDLSNTVLQNPTSVSPSLVPDIRGSYTVQLIVTSLSSGAVSRRDVALVEAVNPGERPPFIHNSLASRCSNCHFEGSQIINKSGDHIATSNLCQACHTTFGFAIRFFTDHAEVFGNCSDCHNGVIAVGKSRWHQQTTLECDDCHNTVSFLELQPDGSYDHSNISRPCEGCHNGTIAVGKNEGHIATTGECNRCHSTESFVPAFFDHDALDYTVTPCVSCHDGDGPGLSSVGKTPTHPATSDNCQICHSTTTFNIAGTFDHNALDDENIQCVTCHDGNHVAAGARGMTNTVVHTNATNGGVDCGNCHNTRDFAQAFVDHTSDAVTLVRCDSCHNGIDAVGVPSPNHVPLTTEDCRDCHTPGNFATGFYDHTAVEADLNIACGSCHNDVITIGKIGNHVPTSDDCRVCHNTTSFAGATVDHSGIVSGCADCHNGDFATGKVDAVPTHIPTNDDCSSCHTTTPLAFSPSTFLSGVHTTITSDCQSCHGTYATAKPRQTHIPTIDDCSTCHVTSAFVPANFDHSGITRGCEGCHNGRFTTTAGAILGKPTDPAAHLPTNQDCYFCHHFDVSAPDWLTSGQSDFAHTGISGNCSSCHNGNYTAMGALGKTSVASGHPDTTADCGACHTHADIAPNGVSFLNYFVDHSGIVNNCGQSGCHDSASTAGTYAASSSHGPTNGNDCELCHTAGVAWVPAVFDHSNITRSTRCDSCHNGVNATGTDAKVNPPHIPLSNGQDCRDCHNTTSFAGATFNHQGITGNCSECHNGVTATGKPTNHVPTNDDCVNCHQTTGFLPATFDHTGIVDNCASCHDGVFATGKQDAVNHIQTTQDCGVCHNTTAFFPATFDHTGIVDNCSRSGCHDGSGNGITYKPATHLATTLDCANCHTTATFVGGTWVHDASTAGRCLDCHVTGGGATPQPTTNHFVTGPGVQCDACHTTNSWADQGTFDHCPNTNANNNRCGDYPGDHRAGKAACLDCHRSNSATPVTYPNDPQYAPFCAGCHAGRFRRTGEHHGGSNGTVAQNKDCGESGCHRVNANGF